MIYDAIYMLCINTLLLMGVILFFIRTVVMDSKPYFVARNLLVISSVLMAIGLITMWTYPKPFGYFCFPILFFTLIEQLLFTFAALSLLRSDQVSIKRIILYLLPVTLSLVIYIVVLFWEGYSKIETLSTLFSGIMSKIIAVRLLFFLLYCVEMTLLIRLFVLQYKKAIEATDLSKERSLRQIKRRYILISIWNICFVLQIFSFPVAYTLFMFIATSCFFGWGILDFLNKFSHFPVNMDHTSPPLKENYSILAVEESNEDTYISGWIEQWVDKKLYTRPGIVLADVALEIGISPKKLSLYISEKYHLNFNTWINTLRIEEAKRFMHQDELISVTELSEMVGFSDRSHFSRQFKQLTGETAISYHRRLKSEREKSVL